jgi:hypothetical protein
MAVARMTREEMIEKLDSLHEGARVQWQGKTWTVYGIGNPSGKLHRRDMNLLEEGKPAYYEVEGKFLAAGKMIECSNLHFRTLYAQPMYMDFDVIG